MASGDSIQIVSGHDLGSTRIQVAAAVGSSNTCEMWAFVNGIADG